MTSEAGRRRWLGGAPALGGSARVAIASADNEVFVSAASAWETSVKRASGKLDAPFDLPQALERNHFDGLPIELRHATEAGQLPPHHKDPFDRMLVAQARLEHLTLVAHDPALEDYDVALLDARA